MGTIFNLTARNVKIYLRDKTAVFFSLLSVFIIIGLYALFLGNTTTNSIKDSLGGRDIEGIRWLVDSWIMAGILVVNSITVTLGIFGRMVMDKSTGKLNGFLVSPISRSKITAGYLFASWIVGIFMTVIAFVLAEIYIVAGGGHVLGIIAILKVLGLIVLSVLSSSTLVFFLVTFISSVSGYSTLSTILGTIIGFITGIYIPIGVLPEAVQQVVKFVPAAHATVLMRQIFMEEPLKKVFTGAPESALTEMKNVFGVDIYAGSYKFTPAVMITILVVSGLLFLGLSVLSLSRKNKGK